MLNLVLFILGGLVLLAIGAEILVRGSSSIALRLGITPLAISLTVVALGTSSPELFVSIEAARAGNGAIALGNVIGSNIGNIGLILGLAALARPMSVRPALLRRDVPLMIAVTLLLWPLLYDGLLSRLEGLLLVLGSVAYTFFVYIAARRESSSVVAGASGETVKGPQRAAWLDVAFVVFGFVGLLVGAKLLLSGATEVATIYGVSQVVIGLTVVAIGTSLPELATSVSASINGQADVAFGNVIGSNILNILCILGVAALIQPIEVQGIRPLDMGVFIGSAVLILLLMWRGATLFRWEGALLLAGYIAYVYSLLP